VVVAAPVVAVAVTTVVGVEVIVGIVSGVPVEPEALAEVLTALEADGVTLALALLLADAAPETELENSCALEYVTQFELAGMRGCHGRVVVGEREAGMDQVVVVPSVVYTPTTSCSSPSQEVNSLGVYEAGML